MPNSPFLPWKNVIAIRVLLSDDERADRTIVKQEKLERN